MKEKSHKVTGNTGSKTAHLVLKPRDRGFPGGGSGQPEDDGGERDGVERAEIDSEEDDDASYGVLPDLDSEERGGAPEDDVASSPLTLQHAHAQRT